MSQRNSRTMISSNVFLCLVKLAFPVGLFRPFSFIFSLFIHFLFLTRVNSSRFNSTWLFFYFAFSRPLFAHSSLFNDVSLHFIAYYVKVLYSADYGFIQWFLFLCLVKLRLFVSTSSPYLQFNVVFSWFLPPCLIQPRIV